MTKLYIRIAEAGTKMHDGSKSSAGHMWFEVRRDDGTLLISSGFSSAGKSGFGNTPFGRGHKETDDYKNYAETYYTAIVDIDDTQYKALKKFSDSPDTNGFSTLKYNALNHSCVDYVYKALEKAKLNPTNFEGDVVPVYNVDDLQRILKGKIIREIHEEKLPDFQPTFGSYMVRSLDENTTELLTISANHNPAPNDFAKLIGQANNLMNTMSAFGSDNAVASFINHDPYAANMPQLAVAA